MTIKIDKQLVQENMYQQSQDSNSTNQNNQIINSQDQQPYENLATKNNEFPQGPIDLESKNSEYSVPELQKALDTATIPQ